MLSKPEDFFPPLSLTRKIPVPRQQMQVTLLTKGKDFSKKERFRRTVRKLGYDSSQLDLKPLSINFQGQTGFPAHCYLVPSEMLRESQTSQWGWQT